MPIARIISVFLVIAIIGVGGILAASVNSTSEPVFTDPRGINIPRDGAPFERLSEYGLFHDFATQTPSDGVVPYDIATPLFTDYASKHRFAYIPEGRAAQYHPERMFEYPVGTILVKTFGYLNDIRDESKGEEIIETRLLIRGNRNWTAWTYVYDQALEDAVLAVDGASRQMTWTHYDGNERTIDYIVPTQKDCRGCHNERYNVVPIGPKAWNLNRDFAYGHGTENQLAHWSALGILEDAPAHEEAPALPVWDDESHASLNERARAYLEVNCAHCHNPNGPANDSGLDLRWVQDDPYALGVGRLLAQGEGELGGGVRSRVDRVLDELFSQGDDSDGDIRLPDDIDGRGQGRRRRDNDDDNDRDQDRRRWDDDDDDDDRDWERRRRDGGERTRDDRRREEGNREREGGRGGFDRSRDEPDFGEGDFDPAGRMFDIVPGKPDESIMVYRMESLEPTVTMPKVPHRLVHEEGVALIREWIRAMEKTDLDTNENDSQEELNIVRAPHSLGERELLSLAERD